MENNQRLHAVLNGINAPLLELAFFETVDTKSYKAERCRGQVYTCTEIEYKLLSGQAHCLVDRSIPDGLYMQLCDESLQQSCNVRTLNPRTMARLFDNGTLPGNWKRTSEMCPNGVGRQQAKETAEDTLVNAQEGCTIPARVVGN